MSKTSTLRKVVIFPFYLVSMLIPWFIVLLWRVSHPEFFEGIGMGVSAVTLIAILDTLFMRLAHGEWV